MQEPNYEWSDLFLKYLANDISDSELEELHRQIAASEWKKEQFLRVSDPDHVIEAMKEHYFEDTQTGWEKLALAISEYKKPVVVPFFKRRWVIAVTAAAVIGVVASIVFWVSTPGEDPSRPSYVKIDGKQRVDIDKAENGVVMDDPSMQLVKNNDTIEIRPKSPGAKLQSPYITMNTASRKMWVLKYCDGSVSRLNASTAIRFQSNFNNDLRHVVILGGECDFKVVKNNMAPFIVQVRDMDIETIGTRYNVNAYKDVTTTLIEGKIKVSIGKKKFFLDSAQQVHYSKNRFDTVGNVNLEQVQAWTQDFFDFKDIGLEQTMKEIGAWYGYEIIVKAKLTKVTYNSTIDRSLPMMDVFQALVPHLKIVPDGKKIYITDPN